MATPRVKPADRMKARMQKSIPVDYEGMDPEMAETMGGEAARVQKAKELYGGGNLASRAVGKVFPTEDKPKTAGVGVARADSTAARPPDGPNTKRLKQSMAQIDSTVARIKRGASRVVNYVRGKR